MSGSTPAGGHSTPSERASLSVSCSPPCPVVGVLMVPCDGAAWVGVQFVADVTGGDGTAGGGAATAGGAWANAGLAASVRAISKGAR